LTDVCNLLSGKDTMVTALTGEERVRLRMLWLSTYFVHALHIVCHHNHPFISVPTTSHNALLAPRRSPVSSPHTESGLKLYFQVSLSFVLLRF